MKTRRRERVQSVVKVIKNRRKVINPEKKETLEEPMMPEPVKPKEISLDFENFVQASQDATENNLMPIKAYPIASKTPMLMAEAKENPEITLKDALSSYFDREIERIYLEKEDNVVIVFSDGDK